MALIGVTGPGVMETSTTTGTGAYTLAGAVTGYQTVGAVLADGDTAYFGAYGVDNGGNRNGDGWEEFYGTYTVSGTSLARTKIEKSSNSNNAVSWGAGTRRIVLIDLPSKSKGLNAVICGVVLPNAKFVRLEGSNLAIGTTDLYTVPSGKRALIASTLTAYNSSAGSITAFPKVKIGATYYREGGSSTLASNTGTVLNGGIVLEPTDKFSIDCATTAGLNVIGHVIEYDAHCPVYSPRLLTLGTGITTIYTCPTGKTAIVLPQGLIPGPGTGVMNLTADGAGHSITMYLVPSGQTAGLAWVTNSVQAIAANSRMAASFPACLGAGDFAALNVNTGAPPMAWLNVVEIGN